jgi:dTDP-4-dehydrorhamnose reductase
MKTCMITGANGLLGREVAAALANDWNIVALSHRPREGYRAIDLRERDQIAALIRETKPDAVVHLAAYREPDFCEENPAEAKRLNVDPVRFFSETLPATSQLLFVSTDYVFDGENPPYAESAARNPISEYGRSKCAAEDVIATRAKSITLRIPLLMGAGSTFAESGFIAQMYDAVTSGKPQQLDDVLVRFPCWTRDVAGAISFLLRGNHGGTFHLSGPRGGTRYAWTIDAAKLLGKPHAHLAPSNIVIPRKAGRPKNSRLSDAKIRALGFRTATDPMAAMQNVLAQFAVTA